MRKLILAVSILAGVSIPAHAQAVPFDFTGQNAIEDSPGLWFPVTFSTPSAGGIGGNDGFGELFTLNNETHFAYLNISATIFPAEPGTTQVTYNLYSKSFDNGDPLLPFPNADSKFFTSSTADFTSTLQQFETESSFDVSNQTPFNVDLQPGTYWLTEEGGGPK